MLASPLLDLARMQVMEIVAQVIVLPKVLRQ